MTDELTLDYVKNYLRIDYDEEQEDRFVEMYKLDLKSNCCRWAEELCAYLLFKKTSIELTRTHKF